MVNSNLAEHVSNKKTATITTAIFINTDISKIITWNQKLAKLFYFTMESVIDVLQ